MKIPGSVKIDTPSYPLLQAHITYWGITTAAGNALGTTLIDALCSTAGLQPGYTGLGIKLLDGNAAGPVKPIAVHALATGTVTVVAPWTDFNGAVYQVPAGTRFVILSAGGGGGAAPVLAPSIGLWMFGECDPAMAASLDTLVMPNLANFPDDIFNNEFWIQVIHNDDAPGTAPEREIRLITNYVGATGTFTTDAFSVNVEAGDLVAVFHESILAIEVVAWGIADAGSDADTLVDAARLEANDYFNGLTLFMTSGNDTGLTRPIKAYLVGTMEIRPALPNAIVAGDRYVILNHYHELIPGVDGAENYSPRDVIGSKASTAIYTPDAVSDMMRYLKGLLNQAAFTQRPMLSLYEGWQDLLIDNTIWTPTNPATGAAWTPQVSGAFIECLAIPNANETARLVGDQLWQIPTGAIATQEIIKRTIIEFEVLLGNVANIDNTLFFLGFSPNAADTRASNNIIGFALIGDALQTVTDLAGVETVNTGFGETLTQHNKGKIDITDTEVRFYLNEGLIATHITNLPAVPCYPNYFIDTEAGGAATLSMRIIRIWTNEA